MTPMAVHHEDDMLLAITQAGRMLMFPVGELPQMSKGKGNKIISIPAADAAAGNDKLAWLLITAGQRGHALCRQAQALVLRSERRSSRRSRTSRHALPRGLQREQGRGWMHPTRAVSEDGEANNAAEPSLRRAIMRDICY